MNTTNNARRRESVRLIETQFLNLIQTREIGSITVSDLCKATGLNRSTFYANFEDIYDLADKIRQNLEADFDSHFAGERDETQDAVRFFAHIRENQIFYKTYFKLGFDQKLGALRFDTERAEKEFGSKNIKYHIEFFRSGLNAMLKMWLDGGCQESPEEMADILRSEYRGR